jgi:hypothetical protein
MIIDDWWYGSVFFLMSQNIEWGLFLLFRPKVEFLRHKISYMLNSEHYLLLEVSQPPQGLLRGEVLPYHKLLSTIQCPCATSEDWEVTKASEEKGLPLLLPHPWEVVTMSICPRKRRKEGAARTEARKQLATPCWTYQWWVCDRGRGLGLSCLIGTS